MWMPREPLVFGHAGTRIEIDAQLVGVREVVGADRVRVQLDAAEVRDPRELRSVVDHDLARRASGGKLELDRPHPVGARLGRALLVEGLLGDAVHIALHHDRAVRDPAQRGGRDGEVVADDVALREARLREEHLARVRDGDALAKDVEVLGRFSG
jgi:hypothetical protein